MRKPKRDLDRLSRRERQIMEVVYRLEEASVREVLNELPDPPTYSSIRASIRILEQKGFLTHREKDGRYVYQPTVRPDSAKASALHRVLDTFFENSASQVLNALLSSRELNVDEDELDRLDALIEEARKQKRRKSK